MNLATHLALTTAALTVPLAAQVTVVASASKDNTLYESPVGTLSNAKGTRLFCGNTATGSTRRALVAFDLSAVPPCSTIQSVRLRLTMNRTRSITRSVSLHRVLADWGEGTSVAFGGQGGGGPASTGDATWLHRSFPTTMWAVVGGHFDANASDTISVGSSGPFVWGSTAPMVADVQGWIDDPSSNFGWLLMTDESTNRTARAFDSRESATVSARPALQITYLPPSASVTSTGTGCAGSGSGPLTAAANGVPSLGNMSFALSTSGGPPMLAQVFDFYLALAPAPIPFGNCFIYTDPTSFVVGVPHSGSLNLPIANNAAWTGISLSVQPAGVDANTMALVTSNALTLKIAP